MGGAHIWREAHIWLDAFDNSQRNRPCEAVRRHLMDKLYIIMVGLPARGKSTIALRLFQSLSEEGVRTRIFNNGELRRARLGPESSHPLFYHPDNREAREKREELAKLNAREAQAFLAANGQVAILDAANASLQRRRHLREMLTDHPILFVECVNEDKDLLEASIERKTRLPEFSYISKEEAIASFKERMSYYERMFCPLQNEGSYIRVDTLRNDILEEKLTDTIPLYIPIRDVLVTNWVKELFLVRHGESYFNIENRIGGDASLTPKGRRQAFELAEYFQGRQIPYIFTSQRVRALETAAPLAAAHPEAVEITLPELDEINAGRCEGMRYEDISREMPEVFDSRQRNKYNYAYPEGESYAVMRQRVERGFRKAMFLSGGQSGVMLIGHQAVNRLILSLFLYRRTEDVPYIYVPQNQFFHIVMTHRTKLFDRIPYTDAFNTPPASSL